MLDPAAPESLGSGGLQQSVGVPLRQRFCDDIENHRMGDLCRWLIGFEYAQSRDVLAMRRNSGIRADTESVSPERLTAWITKASRGG